MDKKILRKEILQKRAKITKEDNDKYSNIIANTLYEMSPYKEANTIMCFISFANEINTTELIETSIKHGKTVVIPITIPETKELKVSQILDFSELEKGYYNILTPKEEFIRYVDPSTIDLVLVPGVVFAENGYRIGYGGGYYDRFLSKLDESVAKIAIGFDLQVVDEVPTESFDIPVDMIITEKRIIKCK
ncbi:5-formyltetrahydrofolate cyclo-ligase [Tissierella sp.]|uniref:5-formyltetrahydrofolate cyclo-ligase n=1 Tax=Tissierella sp. TaxID=41274 RepID=UPI0028661ABB|nr:5-formyltetrahydrofolate cyclo-ligase [Tissierella sp.]MDR7856559.1 5-formyltetrahydrofolate cyclo-ligase [Tissierella sp.]